ncbi:MAG: hypothetical protein LBR90_02055, partial [Elusimicrobiota bacterium]|nr:hypothetical protein [Elusimicrobiota bacterium]
FAVLICYPDHTSFAPLTAFLIGLGVTIAMIVFTPLFHFVGLDKIPLFNLLFDLLVIALVAFLLLSFLTFTISPKPLERLKNGDYPTRSDINRGLERFGVYNFDKNFKRGIDTAIEGVSRGVEEVKAIAVKEENQ